MAPAATPSSFALSAEVIAPAALWLAVGIVAVPMMAGDDCPFLSWICRPLMPMPAAKLLRVCTAISRPASSLSTRPVDVELAASYGVSVGRFPFAILRSFL